MRFEQLEYVTAVTEHGSLRRAGAHLNVSQAAMSEAIGKLERELGVTLLDRHRSGARISDAGRGLLPHISNVLGAVDQLRAATSGQALAQRPVRIGSVNTAVATVVLPSLRSYESANPGALVNFRQLQQDEIRVGLCEGTLDLGLVNLLPDDDIHPQLVGVDLTQGRLVAVLAERHPLARHATVSLEDLRQESFIGARDGHLMHRVAHRLFAGDLPPRWHVVDGTDVAKSMVASGFGVSLIPDFTIAGDPFQAAGLVTTRPIRADVTMIRLVLLQRRGGRLSQSAKELSARLRHYASLHQTRPT